MTCGRKSANNRNVIPRKAFRRTSCLGDTGNLPERDNILINSLKMHRNNSVTYIRSESFTTGLKPFPSGLTLYGLLIVGKKVRLITFPLNGQVGSSGHLDICSVPPNAFLTASFKFIPPLFIPALLLREADSFTSIMGRLTESEQRPQNGRRNIVLNHAGSIVQVAQISTVINRRASSRVVLLRAGPWFRANRWVRNLSLPEVLIPRELLRWPLSPTHQFALY